MAGEPEVIPGRSRYLGYVLIRIPPGSRANREVMSRTDSQRRWPEVLFWEAALLDCGRVTEQTGNNRGRLIGR
jgi:hypothetical protein